MPPRGRGRGHAARGGGVGRGGAKGANGNARNQDRNCKPVVTKLPTHLQILPSSEDVPAKIRTALTEFRHLQPFFSALERIAPEVTTYSRLGACWCGVSEEAVASFERPDSNDGFAAKLTVADKNASYPVFIKRTHILDPLECIEGECIWPADGGLPAPAELWMNALEKLNEPMNEAYVDAVFGLLADKLVATNISPHWLRCFGTCTGRVDRYAFNITEEYPSLRRKTFWARHQAMGLFALKKEAARDQGTRRAREPLGVSFSEDQELDVGDFAITDVDSVAAATATATEAVVGNETTPTNAAAQAVDDSDMIEVDEVDSVQLATPMVRIQRIEGSTSDSSSTNSSDGSYEDSDEDDGLDYFAEFRDFPVQVSLLEKAEGTMDELLDTEEDPAKWTAWIFQVIAGLSVAQHLFGFVHNDLHTNNVMWVRTDREYLYYTLQGKGGKKTVYRVPTHGYLMKIIDFGRASFHLPEPAGFFISDAFFPGNDAGEQYNCEPFFDPKAGKKVEPNPSFDLCRLAVSLLEAIFPTRPANASPIKVMSREGPKTYAETVSPLYNLMWEWLTDDAGKNVLREPNGSERYPDFDLYAAIAADIHRAVPWQQLEKPIFASAFKWTGVPPTEETAYELWTY